MLNNLLLYRIIIVNLIGAGLMAYAAAQGWISTVIAGDSTGLVYAMIGLFVIFIVSLFIRAMKVSQGLNETKFGVRRPGSINGAKFMEKMAHLDDIPNWLVTLGLLGTVIGIMISLTGISQDSLLDADGVKSAITQLMAGMQVAFCTTIAGGVLGLWCDINRRILRTAAVLMLEDSK